MRNLNKKGACFICMPNLFVKSEELISAPPVGEFTHLAVGVWNSNESMGKSVFAKSSRGNWVFNE